VNEPEKPPINIDGLFQIFKTSGLKETDLLLLKSDNAFLMLDYSEFLDELAERLGFRPIVVIMQSNDTIEMIKEEQLYEMGYVRKKETD